MTPTALEVLLEKDLFDTTADLLVATVRGTAWTGTGSRAGNSITLMVRWRRTAAARDTANDLTVETKTGTTDEWGIVSFQVDGTNYHTGSDNTYYLTAQYGTPPTEIKAYSDDFTLLNRGEALLNDLEVSLDPLQNIPIYSLYPQEVEAGTTFHFEIKQWNTTPTPKVRKNGSLVTPSAIDYDDGTVTLGSATLAGDDVELEFATFRFFLTGDLHKFVNLTVSDLNSLSPTTSYNRYNLPDHMRGTVVYGARGKALDEVCLSTIFQEKKLIFADDLVRSFVSAEAARMSQAFWQQVPHLKKRSMAGGRVITSHDKFDYPASYAWPGLFYWRGARRRPY